jgi:hypothetical protein
MFMRERARMHERLFASILIFICVSNSACITDTPLSHVCHLFVLNLLNLINKIKTTIIIISNYQEFTEFCLFPALVLGVSIWIINQSWRNIERLVDNPVYNTYTDRSIKIETYLNDGKFTHACMHTCIHTYIAAWKRGPRTFANIRCRNDYHPSSRAPASPA